MNTARQTSEPIVAEGDIAVNLQSFRRSLRTNRSPRTIQTYTEAVEQLIRFLAERGMPLVVANVTREHIDEFILSIQKRWKPATAANRYRALQAFFKYLGEEGELPGGSPMVNMRPPRVPDEPPDMLREEDLKRLLRTCETGTSFEDRRDAALMRVFIDTGARLSEVTDLRWDPSDVEVNDVDLEQGRLRVLGKGNRWRVVSIGNKAVRCLDRYLRRRAQHSGARAPWLWLGNRGRMTPSGVRQMFWRRGEQAGLGKVHPHQLRHSAAHMWLAEGAGESDLMRLMGWRSRSMLDRYGRTAATERALAAHKRYGLGDRL